MLGMQEVQQVKAAQAAGKGARRRGSTWMLGIGLWRV